MEAATRKEAPNEDSAAEILRAILATLAPHARWKIEKQGEETLLRFAHGGHYGTSYIHYSPAGLVERLLVDCDDLLDYITALITARSVNGELRNQKLNEKPLREVDRQYLVKAFAKTAARFYIEGYIDKCVRSDAELLNEALILAAAAMQTQIVKGLSNNEKADVELIVTWIKEGFEEHVNSMMEERLNFLKGSFERSFPKPDFSSLRSRYESLLTIWRDAKKTVTKNRNDSGWQSVIRAKFPTLPDDLIEKLGHQGESSPSDIAVEHAARLCGADHNAFSARHYFRLMNGKNGDSLKTHQKH